MGDERDRGTTVTRVNIIVEGETEEAFVKNVLAPHLGSSQVYAVPLLTPLKRGARQRVWRGGIGTSFAAARRLVRRKVTDDTQAYTTTMFDYYGLPDDFPGMDDDNLPPPVQWQERIGFLEERFAQEMEDSPRFVPYLQAHEFEALLFSDVEAINRAVGIFEQTPDKLDQLRQILDECGEPEAINDDPETAPSKRLRQLYPGYDKVVFGDLIAGDIGIDKLRDRCPRFGRWVGRLEVL